MGAHEFIKALPNGYDTDVGERGMRLSAGQRQLVALCVRADRRPAPDEATANVDVHAEAAIEEGMRTLLAGRTSIVIAHRLDVVGADRTAPADGQVVETGSHDELIEAGGRLYRSWASTCLFANTRPSPTLGLSAGFSCGARDSNLDNGRQRTASCR